MYGPAGMNVTQAFGWYAHDPVVESHESTVHGSLSSQLTGVPLWQPSVLSHVSVPLHESPSLQSSGEPGVQDPSIHTSSVVQTLPSSQGAMLCTNTHPVCGSQLSSVHALLSLQTTCSPGSQMPVWHASFVLQALPSSHTVPFRMAGFEHSPVVVLHIPSKWHWSSGVQTVSLKPTHWPLWQKSPDVHALPSLQPSPSFMG
jgi:hypothetical protein